MSRPIIQKKGRSKRGKMTPEESAYIALCVANGCLVCERMGHPGTIAMFHHCKEGWHGAGMRAPHSQGYALCYTHHAGDRGIHTYKARFFADAGMTEAELVAWSRSRFA